MFRRWPFFQRLLSWTKPHAPVPRGSRAYERYDWNSLLSEDPACRAIQPGLMDGTSYFPSRPEMEANIATFAERAGVVIRYGCRWTATAHVGTADGDAFEVDTTDGRYRCRVLIVAVGVAEPYTPPGLGMEFTHHYAEVRPVEAYADRRILLIGKQNSGSSSRPGSCRGPARSFSRRRRGRGSRSRRRPWSASGRATSSLEDHVLGGGVSVLDAAIDRIERPRTAA